MTGGQDGAGVEAALGGFSGDEGWTLLTTLERGGAGGEVEVALGFLGAVAAQAGGFEQRFDVEGEVHLRSGEAGKRGEDGQQTGREMAWQNRSHTERKGDTVDVAHRVVNLLDEWPRDYS
jgi:hypothetical protein